MTQSYQNGYVDINRIDLSSHDGKKVISLIAQVTAISIYEDILCPIIYAELDIADSADLHSSFPLIGEEFIDLEFKTTGNTETNKYRFSVVSTNNVTTNNTGRIKTYKIRCASEEILNNSTLKLNQRMSGKSEDLIKKFLTDSNYLATKKNVNLETTKGPQDLLITKLSPFQAVDLVRKRSVSPKYISSSYCFFENKRGFNFCTVEFLFDQGKSNIKDKIFWYDSKPETDVRAVRFRNILGFRTVSGFDTASKMSFGGLNNMVRKFDIFTGEMTEIKFNNAEKQDQFKFASDNAVGLNSSYFENKYGLTSGYTMLVPHRGDLPDTFIPDTLGARQAFVQKLIQNIFQIHTYGDSEITAGDVITIKVPQIKGTTDEPKENRLVSGNYLVSKLRHTIVLDKQRLYTNSMELIRGEYEEHI